MTISNPKRVKNKWNSHYASFSEEFVSSILIDYKNISNIKILDPWNGFGTTTYVCGKHKIKAIGVDVNPIATIIADARQCTIEPRRLLDIVNEIINDFQLTEISKDDLLLDFFESDGSTIIRSLSQSILSFFNNTDQMWWGNKPNHEACSILFCALFRLIRDIYIPNFFWIITSQAS